MSEMSLKEDIVKAMEDLDEKRVTSLARQLRESGCSQDAITDLLMLGMRLVGIRYEEGEYYIADLIMSGIILRTVLGLDDSLPLPYSKSDDTLPAVLVGTVEGDIHDIGKDIFISMLKAKDVRVLDLGVDVAPERFVEAIEKEHPSVVVLSGTMNFAAGAMQRTIEKITRHGLRDQVRILVGGNCINQNLAFKINADGYSADLVSSVALCKRWLTSSEAS